LTFGTSGIQVGNEVQDGDSLDTRHRAELMLQCAIHIPVSAARTHIAQLSSLG
jgi:hypothetical protein